MQAPQLPGLQVISGELRLDDLGLFGDVTTNDRTKVEQITVALQAGEEMHQLDGAPYGLYSRLRIGDFALQLIGTWNDMPLLVAFEFEDLAVEARFPPVDCSPLEAPVIDVRIDASAWFAGDPLSGAPTVDGTVTVSAGASPKLARAVANAIPSSVSVNGVAGQATIGTAADD
jgi:hypothetical protein